MNVEQLNLMHSEQLRTLTEGILKTSSLCRIKISSTVLLGVP